LCASRFQRRKNHKRITLLDSIHCGGLASVYHIHFVVAGQNGFAGADAYILYSHNGRADHT
jgi:hypothetical protein